MLILKSMTNHKRWSTFDITWFTSQLLALLIINIITIATYDALWIALVSTAATLFGATGTWLAVKKYNINYLFGIIHVILYGLIAFITMVYGDFFLNIFIFLPLDIWGWVAWIKHNKKPDCECPNIESCTCVKMNKVEVRKLSINNVIIAIVVLFVSTLLFATLLWWLNDPAALLDAASTTISIFGMWLMIRYYREQWWVWLFVNLVSVAIWVQVLMVTGDIITLPFIAMWLIYTMNSIIGIKRWNQNGNN